MRAVDKSISEFGMQSAGGIVLSPPKAQVSSCQGQLKEQKGPAEGPVDIFRRTPKPVKDDGRQGSLRQHESSPSGYSFLSRVANCLREDEDDEELWLEDLIRRAREKKAKSGREAVARRGFQTNQENCRTQTEEGEEEEDEVMLTDLIKRIHDEKEKKQRGIEDRTRSFTEKKRESPQSNEGADEEENLVLIDLIWRLHDDKEQKRRERQGMGGKKSVAIKPNDSTHGPTEGEEEEEELKLTDLMSRIHDEKEKNQKGEKQKNPKVHYGETRSVTNRERIASPIEN
uniref:Uncharacterized protein n=1 Tax=Chromera velia CCMP2878 TaxID=1169474 RepID=A0A0G4FEN5_9ALVE|eukprot:Cvel_3239.t1-p1 / transcript=Cvel_3239.t1 / gene=Cvel_3239 / organism=Chromera_velia_CCMP2878 / gene_product=hypothetical protein / transcript_product=hypothetical protein / location=Cvel_scaffold127:21617-22471(-) / protein_length=285 / sequence_SO=supercontig / SO=protein_coding / is_pseudo=false